MLAAVERAGRPVAVKSAGDVAVDDAEAVTEQRQNLWLVACHERAQAEVLGQLRVWGVIPDEYCIQLFSSISVSASAVQPEQLAAPHPVLLDSAHMAQDLGRNIASLVKPGV
jgi:hypothetical protein